MEEDSFKRNKNNTIDRNKEKLRGNVYDEL